MKITNLPSFYQPLLYESNKINCSTKATHTNIQHSTYIEPISSNFCKIMRNRNNFVHFVPIPKYYMQQTKRSPVDQRQQVAGVSFIIPSSTGVEEKS